MFPTTLTTVRLRLRPLELADADAMFERWANDPVATRHVSWKTYQCVDEARGFIEKVTKPDANPNEIVWAVCIGDDPMPSGTIGAIRRRTRVEIGYLLCRAAWGQGFATEAAQAVVSVAWKLEGIWRVEGHCHVDNKASARVLEKCGMQYEGRHRRYLVMPQCGEEAQDVFSYAQVREEL